jgi:hypothetical protein
MVAQLPRLTMIQRHTSAKGRAGRLPVLQRARLRMKIAVSA